MGGSVALDSAAKYAYLSFSFNCEDYKNIIPFVKKKIVRIEEDKVPQKFWKKLFEMKKHTHSVKKRRQNAKGGQIRI